MTERITMAQVRRAQREWPDLVEVACEMHEQLTWMAQCRPLEVVVGLKLTPGAVVVHWNRGN